MIVFLGSYSGGGGGTSDRDDTQDEDSTDTETQTGLDEYSGDDKGGTSGQGSGGGGSPVPGPGGAAGGAAGGGVIVDPTGSDDSGDSRDEEDSRDDNDTEDLDSPDPDESDSEGENDADESRETEEETEEETEDDEDDENDEDEEDTVVVFQQVDPLSATSWGVQPVMNRIQERYGDQIEVVYRPAPVREFDDPEQPKQEWVQSSETHDMPVDPSFWDQNPPTSTELVNRAFGAAIEQGQGIEYLRLLWRRAVGAGRDIDDIDYLRELASQIRLDVDQFQEDLEEIDLEFGTGTDALPYTVMEIQGAPVPLPGRLDYVDFKTQFTFQGLEEQDLQDLRNFVEEYGPVATPEAMETYEIKERSEAIRQLQNIDSISAFEIGDVYFWHNK